MRNNKSGRFFCRTWRLRSKASRLNPDGLQSNTLAKRNFIADTIANNKTLLARCFALTKDVGKLFPRFLFHKKYVRKEPPKVKTNYMLFSSFLFSAYEEKREFLLQKKTQNTTCPWHESCCVGVKQCSIKVKDDNTFHTLIMTKSASRRRKAGAIFVILFRSEHSFLHGQKTYQHSGGASVMPQCVLKSTVGDGFHSSRRAYRISEFSSSGRFSS